MIALTNATVVTVSGEVLQKGTVLVEEGKIKAVGTGVPIPAGAQVLDLEGHWVTPGLIDAHTHISVMGEPHPADRADGNEMTEPITPHLRVIDALHPQDIGMGYALRAGFTTCYTGPGSGNIIGGTGISFKLRSAVTVDDIVFPGSEQMKMALGENPKRVYGEKGKSPYTRMGTAALLRETLRKARDYADEQQAAKEGFDDKKPPKFDPKLEALVPVVRGEMKCRIHCHRMDDIYTAMRIAEEFELDYAIEHCTEGYKMAQVLADRKVTCVVGPLTMGLQKKEIWETDLNNPRILHEAGVEFCLTEDASAGTRWLPMHVGLCIGRGLPEEAAFRAVTINPARLLGLADRIGTLEVGKDADLAVFNGHPFLNTTLCKATMVDGVWEYSEL